ncbi:phosphatase PAP2 family protein [Vibrio sp. ZSDE26]|uniref:undecaprenyl-diphosphate phosphatase n=2 Tax=Vibrio amylolyticus TaxID=2847292 RepID=A0A9X1XKZ9_9VIBR|nr:phosphatase PAP2 family protein [Vibrio amylolyticus]MCK6264120.1 phosphatase PAP2 family protein [Vibrio amylolyticus]
MSSDSWSTLSDIGAYGLVGVALAVPAYKEDWQGFQQAGLSIATGAAVAFVGKVSIDSERPDGSNNHSFPSGHTTNAFSSATTLYLRYGWEAGLPAYTMATLVGVGRVEADRHYWKDVLAGAAIGVASAWVFTDAFDENVQLVPWIENDSYGVSMRYRW